MKKFTKKAVSLAVASFVTVSSAFGGNVISADAATKNVVSAMAATQNYKVTYTPPTSWTGEIYAYSYYDVTDASGKISQEEKLGYWPGTKMTKNSDGTYSVDVPTTIGMSNVIFASITGPVGTEVLDGERVNADGSKTVTHYYKCTKQAQYPEDKMGGVIINSDSIVDQNGNVTKVTPATEKPTATPKVTKTPATEKPTAAPTVTPVDGPQVKVSVANATSYYEEESDTLSVVMDLAEGATSATYSIDNGPKTTITGKTVIKLGEGKIAGTDIKLDVTSTDGKTENTQTFTYAKKSKAAESATTSKTAVASLVSAFSVVKASAVSVAKTLPVHFKVPDGWTDDGGEIYCYAYYTDANGQLKKPLDVWPGTKMAPSSDGYYNVNIKTTTGNVKVMFSSIQGGKGYYHGVGSDVKDAYGNVIGKSFEEYYDGHVKCQLPYGLSDKVDGGNTIPVEGLTIDREVWIAYDQSSSDKDHAYIKVDHGKEVDPDPIEVTPTPTVSATPTTKPTATPTPELDAYFGASLSAPQLNTTAQTLSAVALNASGKVQYSFSVDGEEIYSGNQNNVAWDTSLLAEGTHEISATVTDKSGKTVTKKKNYTIVVSAPAVTATPEVTETPATATPEITEAPATATPVVTETPTATPVVTETPTATPIVTETPIPTATVAPVVTLPAIDNSVANAPVVSTNPSITAVTEGAIIISFNKVGKTAGETIKVSADASSVADAAKLTYTVTKNNSSIKTLASKTTKSSVNWTPTASGTYTVEVIAYNAKGDAVATGSTTYVVKKRVINIKAIKPAKIRAGKTSTMKITATCTKGTLRLKVVIKNSKKKTVKSVKYTKKKNFKWKPSKKGTYKVTITGKNSKGVVVTVTKKVKVLKKATKKVTKKAKK